MLDQVRHAVQCACASRVAAAEDREQCKCQNEPLQRRTLVQRMHLQMCMDWMSLHDPHENIRADSSHWAAAKCICAHVMQGSGWFGQAQSYNWAAAAAVHMGQVRAILAVG